MTADEEAPPICTNLQNGGANKDESDGNDNPKHAGLETRHLLSAEQKKLTPIPIQCWISEILNYPRVLCKFIRFCGRRPRSISQWWTSRECGTSKGQCLNTGRARQVIPNTNTINHLQKSEHLFHGYVGCKACFWNKEMNPITTWFSCIVSLVQSSIITACNVRRQKRLWLTRGSGCKRVRYWNTATHLKMAPNNCLFN